MTPLFGIQYHITSERSSLFTKRLCPDVSTLFVPISIQSSKSKSDHTVLLLVTKKNNEIALNKLYSARTRVWGSRNLKWSPIIKLTCRHVFSGSTVIPVTLYSALKSTRNSAILDPTEW